MSNHKDSLVKVLEYLVNDEREKASDLLHTIFVEKAKNHWSAITESDEEVEEEIQDEDLDETIDVSDEEDDFLSDIETAEEEIDNEEIFDAEEMDDDEASDELSFDMGADDDMGAEDDMEGDDSDAEAALANVEEAVVEVEVK